MAQRLNAQAAYVLHTRPYLETSALVDFFTLEHGRVSAVVKGVRRPNSKLRGIIQPFVPLQVSWQGKQDLKTLLQAESVGLNGLLQGNALMCGLYVNELLQRLLQPFDPAPRLYLYYQYVLNALVANDDIEGALRTFERKLLAETGYELPLHEPLDAQLIYRFNPEQWCFEPLHGLIPDVYKAQCFRAQHLQPIGDDCYDEPAVRQAAKRLMRLAIDHLAGDKPLRSRTLFQKY